MVAPSPRGMGEGDAGGGKAMSSGGRPKPKVLPLRGEEVPRARNHPHALIPVEEHAKYVKRAWKLGLELRLYTLHTWRTVNCFRQGVRRFASIGEYRVRAKPWQTFTKLSSRKEIEHLFSLRDPQGGWKPLKWKG